MATQPDNCSEDLTENNFIDFDRMVFDTNDFNHAYNALNLGLENGPLNTPELSRQNPFFTSGSGSDIQTNNDMSKTNFQQHQPTVIDKVPSEASDDEIISLILDIEVDNNMDNHSKQQMLTNPQERIAAIENDLQNSVNKTKDAMDIGTVMTAIKRYPHSTMSMRVQPIQNQRIHYKSDGPHCLKGSQTNPISINLPRLDQCLLKPYQSFWVQGTLVTTRQNPHRKVFHHQHRMVFNDINSEQIGLGSFRSRLTGENIRQRIKKFRHLSVIKTKRSDYNFELIPFDPLIVDDHTEYYTVEDQLTKIKKSKRFDRTYHTNDFRIVFQLMIKQNEEWFTTDLYCETLIITDN